jgi:cysteine sulfinate desulfinase/cysteine desulfurase-like protein
MKIDRETATTAVRFSFGIHTDAGGMCLLAETVEKTARMFA